MNYPTRLIAPAQKVARLISNKMEILPWGVTELMDEQKHPHREISALIETIIDLTTSREDRLSEIRMVYQKHPGLRMPLGWKPWWRRIK